MSLLTIPFPADFTPRDFVEPCAQPSGDGAWYFVGYGNFPGERVHTYVFRAAGDGTPAVIVPIERPTLGRGSLAIGGLGKGLWLLSYDGPHLIQQSVPGWTPPYWIARDIAP
jgi:hypothetical protein